MSKLKRASRALSRLRAPLALGAAAMVVSTASVLAADAPADQQPTQQPAGPPPPSSTTKASPASPASPSNPTEEVTITGTRIKQTTDFTTPTPTTVIDSETMNNLGIVNIGQALQTIPANITEYAPTTTGDSPFFIGAYIPDLRGLNPEFATRTLTLIDGQRAVPTNSAGSFDLNLVPQILTQRIDTVTGGASAAYGSGAEAGVVNIVLDDKLEGGKINGDFYQTHESDARDRHIGAAFGHSFADGRFHFVIGGEFEKQDGLGCQDARSWCARDASLQVQGYAPTLAAYVPLYGSAVVPHQTSPTISPTGVFIPAYAASQFANGRLSLPSWQLLQLQQGGAGFTYFDQGTYPPATLPGTPNCPWCYIFAPGSATNGRGIPTNQYNQIMTPTTRGVITAALKAKVTDSINVKLDVNWGKTQSSQLDYPGLTESFPVYAGGTVCQGAVVGGVCQGTSQQVPGNPYLTSAQWAQLASAYVGASQVNFLGSLGLPGLPPNIPGVTEYVPTPGVYQFGKDLTNQLVPTQNFTTTLKRMSLSFDGRSARPPGPGMPTPPTAFRIMSRCSMASRAPPSRWQRT